MTGKLRENAEEVSQTGWTGVNQSMRSLYCVGSRDQKRTKKVMKMQDLVITKMAINGLGGILRVQGTKDK